MRWHEFRWKVFTYEAFDCGPGEPAEGGGYWIPQAFRLTGVTICGWFIPSVRLAKLLGADPPVFKLGGGVTEQEQQK